MDAIYIGWDAREDVAYRVCAHSICSRWADTKAKIFALDHRKLRQNGWFSRPWLTVSDSGNWIDLIDNRPFSTEFSHTRFLVPALQGYKGWALFMDCDMLVTCNLVKELRAIIEKNQDKALLCVKHDHKPKEAVKMDGREQAVYGRKNWSSFMLFNCAHPANKALTPEYVTFAAGRDLHQMAWLKDSEIGELPADFNWLEGSSPMPLTGKPRNIHYTRGGPWFDNYQDVTYADLWLDEKERMDDIGEDFQSNELPVRKNG